MLDTYLLNQSIKRFDDLNAFWNDKKFRELKEKYIDSLSSEIRNLEDEIESVLEFQNDIDNRLYDILGGN